MRAVVVMVASAVGAGAAPPAERVLTRDATLPVAIDGAPARLRIDPGAPGLMLLAPGVAAASRPGGHGLLTFGVMYHVGPERIGGPTKVARVGIDGAAAVRRRVGWPARAYADGVDAVVGPMGIDAPVVRFDLHPPRGGERTATLPMAKLGGLFGDWFGSFAQIDVGGAPMLVRFAPYQAHTVANAGAARRLAAAGQGRMTADVGSATIAFGIARPVRDMTLARPLPVGPLSVATLAVRTADGGSIASIPEEGAAAAAADPDEVVVTAKKDKRDWRRDRLTLGADLLDRCSTLVFDKPAKEIRLTCG